MPPEQSQHRVRHQAAPYLHRAPSAFTEPVANPLEQQLRQLGRENELLKLGNEQLARALAEATALRSEAQRMAHHDGLTGLPNRVLLMERLQEGIADCFARQRQLALMFIDLDGFKIVNDRYGHSTGDKLLTVVATRIAACVRSDDLACRYGGDEFVVMLNDISEASVAAAVADQIRNRIDGRYWIEGQEIQVSASIGLALYPGDGEQWDALLSCADASMYRNKCERRERVVALPCGTSLAEADQQMRCRGEASGLDYVRYQTDCTGRPL